MPTLLTLSRVLTPVVGVLPGALVTSETILAAALINGSAALSTSDPGVSFIINGAIRGGQSLTIYSGESLAVSVIASDQLATPKHITFTLAGIAYSFSCCTAFSLVTSVPGPIAFKDSNTVLRGAVCLTNSVMLWSVEANETYNVSIPNIYGAVLRKNNVDLPSRATTGVLGDTFQIRFTAPTTANCRVQIPLFIGNVYDYFLSVTTGIDDVPTGFTFEDFTSVEFSTEVTSHTITVAGLDAGLAVDLSITAGKIVKNGITLAPLTTTVVNGDTIALKLTSDASPNFTSATHTIVSVGGTYKTSWSIVTKTSNDLWVNSTHKNKALYDVALIGHTAVTLNQNNALVSIDRLTYATTSYSLYNPTVTADTAGTPDLYSLSFYENRIYKIELSGAVVGSITIPAGSTVFDICYAPKISTTPVATRAFVTLSGTLNVVRELESANADIAIAGGALYGLDTSRDGSELYVVTNSNTVVRLLRNATTGIYSVSNTINLTSYSGIKNGLRQLVTDKSNNIWILDCYNSQVLCVTPSTGSLRNQITISNSDPWDIVCDNLNNIWIVGSYSNSLTRINANTGTITGTVITGSVPCSVSFEDETGNVWVGHYGSNLINVYHPATLALIRTITMSRPVSGLGYVNGKMWAQCLYRDLATFQQRLGPWPILSVQPIPNTVNTPASSTIISTTQVAANLTRPAPISVVPFPNQFLNIRASNTAGKVTISNNDSFGLTITPSSSVRGVTTTVKAFAGPNAFTWTSSTLPDLVPDPVYFEDVIDLDPMATAVSLPAVITGITAVQDITLSTDDSGWGITVNGGAVQKPTATARLGDAVALVGPTANRSGNSKTVSLMVTVSGVPTIFAEFSSHTKKDFSLTSPVISAPRLFGIMFYTHRILNSSLLLSEMGFIARRLPKKMSEDVPSYVSRKSNIHLTNAPSGTKSFTKTIAYTKIPEAEKSFTKTIIEIRTKRSFETGAGIAIAVSIAPDFELRQDTASYEGGVVLTSTSYPRTPPYFVSPVYADALVRTKRNFSDVYYSLEPKVRRDFSAVKYSQTPKSQRFFSDLYYTSGNIHTTRYAPDPVYDPQVTVNLRVFDAPSFTRVYRQPVFSKGAEYVLSERLTRFTAETPTTRKVKKVTLGSLPGPTKPVREKILVDANSYVVHPGKAFATANRVTVKAVIGFNDSGAGHIVTQQKLFASAADAIAAGVAAGHPKATAYEFDTVVMGPDGKYRTERAFMWVIPARVTARNCMLPVPVGGYLQGG